tara:strand:+ start:1596 stop:1859 length:264 start_codon:yes stop_codon:yes gene_type:complete
MTDYILHAKGRRVTRIHTSHQDGEPYSADITHFFVTEDGWADFVKGVNADENQTIEMDWTDYVIHGSTSYGPVKIFYKQYTLWHEEE